jgi:AmmeMemoRadiSam system protein A
MSNKTTSMNLTKEEQQTLLQIARSAIEAALEAKSLPPRLNKNKALNKCSGVFVTLRTGEDLRGCIGYIEPYYPLADAVQEAAVKAALEDMRFTPMTRPEFSKVTIEISVLSPLSEVQDVEKIEVGKHGLVIDAGSRRGLLLPQVAIEYNWDRMEFLKHTSLKAGLSVDAWKRKGTKLFSFTVEKFDESEFTAGKR